MKIYLIASLRNPIVPEIANELEERTGHEIFDDWFAGGPIADDSWRDYEKARHRSYGDALRGYAARHVFDFDKWHLDQSEGAVLLLPAGKSGHLELGYMAGKGKKTAVLWTEGEPERYDVMYQFANDLCFSMDELVERLRQWA